MRITAGSSGKERRIVVLLPDGWANIRAEGEARRHAAWADWYARWKECQDKGEPFDEPPPAPLDGYHNGKSGSNGE